MHRIRVCLRESLSEQGREPVSPWKRLLPAVQSLGHLTRRLIDIKTTFFFQEEAWTPGMTTLLSISMLEGDARGKCVIGCRTWKLQGGRGAVRFAIGGINTEAESGSHTSPKLHWPWNWNPGPSSRSPNGLLQCGPGPNLLVVFVKQVLLEHNYAHLGAVCGALSSTSEVSSWDGYCSDP